MIRILLAVVLISSAQSFAAKDDGCAAALARSKSLIHEKIFSSYMKRFDKLSPAVRNLIGRKSAETLLLDDSQPITRVWLMDLLDKLTAKATPQKLKQVVRQKLEDRVPERQIAKRIQELGNDRPESLRRALGFKTLEEVQELVYGRDPLKPSPESLLGRYIAETRVKSVTQKFARGPQEAEGRGTSKLAVTLTPSSRKKFIEYFELPEVMMHYHTPRQGTLDVYFNGAHWGYAGASYNEASTRDFTENHLLLPVILLSSAEANRMDLYFQLGQFGGSLAQYPWDLPGYCAKGGYSSCTHWFGEIPVGDSKVSSYSFPGRVDTYATSGVTSPDPQTKRLKIYWDSKQYEAKLEENSGSQPTLMDHAMEETLTPERHRFIVDRLIRQVWTVPGHEQLADMLGEKAAKLRGEFANPGYVAHVLLGRVSNERVPVVFRIQGASEDFSEGFDPEISAH